MGRIPHLVGIYTEDSERPPWLFETFTDMRNKRGASLGDAWRVGCSDLALKQPLWPESR